MPTARERQLGGMTIAKMHTTCPSRITPAFCSKALLHARGVRCSSLRLSSATLHTPEHRDGHRALAGGRAPTRPCLRRQLLAALGGEPLKPHTPPSLLENAARPEAGYRPPGPAVGTRGGPLRRLPAPPP